METSLMALTINVGLKTCDIVMQHVVAPSPMTKHEYARRPDSESWTEGHGPCICDVLDCWKLLGYGLGFFAVV